MIFESENDWSQFLQGIIISVAILFSGGNMIATLMAIFVFFLGFYFAFGKKVIIYNSYFCYQTFLKTTKFDIAEIKYIEFNPGFLGKSFFTIVLKSNKKMKAFCSGKNKLALKKITTMKNIKFISR